MAVAYTSDTDKTPATGTTIAWTSFAVSGSNPVVLLGLQLASATATFSSVVLSAGLSSGTPVQVIASRKDVCYLAIWAIPAPSGTGTITVTLSASVPWQANAILLSGADQTTPCPGADAKADTTIGGTSGKETTVVMTNVAANDAVYGITGINNGDGPSWTTGTQVFNNNTTIINAAAAYAIGTATLVAEAGAAGSPESAQTIGVRIAAAAGGTVNTECMAYLPPRRGSHVVNITY